MQSVSHLKKRIEYIDLMKGVCMILIIILHCHAQFPMEKINIMLSYFEMPLYFFLSGLFFKEYSCFKGFFSRKFCQLIIPYFFFSFFPYIISDYIAYNNTGFKSFFMMFILPYNEPLWFLRSLFMTYMLYYAFYKLVGKNKYMMGIFIMLISCVLGYLIVKKYIKYNQSTLIRYCFDFNLFTSILLLPFFYIAYLVKPFLMKLENRKLPLKYVIACLGVSLFVWYVASTSPNECFVRMAYLGDSYFTFLLSSFGGIFCLWALSYILNRIFYISYLGRYSLIVLGTHYTLCIVLNWLSVNSWIMVTIVLLLMPFYVVFFKRYFPYFTAQKNIIVYDEEEHKIKITPSLYKKIAYFKIRNKE